MTDSTTEVGRVPPLADVDGCVVVIAEAGQTHGGDVSAAIELATAAKHAGADAIKFQHLTPELIAQPDARLYWDEKNPAIRSQRDAFAANGILTRTEWERVAAHCDTIGIEFMSTPFDRAAVDQLLDLGVRRFKLASGDLTNRPLIERVAATGLPVILSTGAAAVGEIGTAVRWWREAGGAGDVALLACSLIYPCPSEHAHLDRIQSLIYAFIDDHPTIVGFPNVRIGYSDHTREVETALAAVAAGATVLEKHFCLGANHVPDTGFALTPPRMVEYVRYAQMGAAMVADCATDCESAARQGARRSVCAARVLPEGHQLTAEDLVMLRPAGGIDPARTPDLVGCFVTRTYAAGEPLHPSDITGLD